MMLVMKDFQCCDVDDDPRRFVYLLSKTHAIQETIISFVTECFGM